MYIKNSILFLNTIIALLFFTNAVHATEPCSVRSPINELCTVRIADLHPTQMSVGLRAVKEKEEKLAEKSPKKLEKYKLEHPEPTVIGPGGKLYIIDHHHLGRALWNLRIEGTYATIVANFSRLSEAGFWKMMEQKKWVYAYDENGKGPHPYSKLPSSVANLRDDPYRSLAGAARDAGAYEKTSTPFAEFKWADFFRARIKIGTSDKDFENALDKAIKLAQSKEAANLPGYLP